MRLATPFITRWRRFRQAWSEFSYGMMVHGWVMAFYHEWIVRQNLFLLVVFGDIIGVPILPPYYTLRLLPYAMSDFDFWKRRLLRPKDFSGIHE
ncbi:MAG: hypothetical protein HYR71_04055 [Chloroflexi bacterium]|nr:hypothetical protein [Chloroflexota bacterium]